MRKPHVFWDFLGIGLNGWAILEGLGTARSLARQGLVLHEGMEVTLWEIDPELDGTESVMLIEAVVTFDHSTRRWMGVTDRSTYRRELLSEMEWLRELNA